MATFFLTFVFFAIAVTALAIGVIVTGKSIKGSCGGPSCKCSADGKELTRCDEPADALSLPVHPNG